MSVNGSTETRAHLEKQIGGLPRKLANVNFTSRAPEQVAEKARTKLRDFELSLEKIESSLAQLKG